MILVPDLDDVDKALLLFHTLRSSLQLAAVLGHDKLTHLRGPVTAQALWV